MTTARQPINQAGLIDLAPDAILVVDEAAEIVLANARAAELFGYDEEEIMGQPLDLLLPECDGDWLTAGSVKLQNADHKAGREPQADGRRRDGTQFRCEIAMSAMEVEDGRLAIASIRDVTERDAAGHHFALAMRKLRAAADVAVAVGNETDLERVLALIVERGRELVDARTMMVILEDNEELVISALAGERGEQMRGRNFRDLDQIREELRLGADDEWLSVALNFKGHSMGTVLAVEHISIVTGFSEDDHLMLEAFAASVAVAVATAQSVETGRLRDSVRASERERGRWARALHDETLQGLASLRIALISALRKKTPEEMRVQVGWVAEQITEQVRLLRGLVTELRPLALDELGLEVAIQALANRSEQIDGLKINRSFSLSGHPDLSSEVETTIYRVVQEALTNVAKHAGDTAVDLMVTYSEETLTVQVRDHGVGFDPAVSGEGYGLRGMRERAGLVGASIQVDSHPGEGSEIRVEIPIGSSSSSYKSTKPLLIA